MKFHSIKEKLEKARKNAFLIGFLSLIWFSLRTGTRPSRALYPCQRAAATNIHIWLTTSLIPFFQDISQKLMKVNLKRKTIVISVLLMVIVGSSLIVWKVKETEKIEQPDQVIRLTLKGHWAKIKPSSDIFVVNGATGRNDGFIKLIDLMGAHGLPFYKSEKKGRNQGPNGLIARDDVTIIKVNCQWNERGGTNTDLLREIIEAIIKHPEGFIGEIIVADNGQAQYGALGHGGNLDWKKNNAEDQSQSIQKVVDEYSKSYKVSTYLWDKITLKRVYEYWEEDMEDGYIVNQTANPITGIKVSYPKFRTKYGTYISFKLGVWNPETKTYDSERLKVINVPVLKTHFIYGVTACVKHYMGVVSDKLTGHNAHQSVGNGGMGTEMVETRMPILNILDAIWINAKPRGGPRTSYSEATRVNIIMASTDPIALDYWAAKHVLMQTAEILGFNDLSSIDPDNTAPGSFGEWLRLSMQVMRSRGYQATINEEQVNVYVVDLSES